MLERLSEMIWGFVPDEDRDYTFDFNVVGVSRPRPGVNVQEQPVSLPVSLGWRHFVIGCGRGHQRGELGGQNGHRRLYGWARLPTVAQLR